MAGGTHHRSRHHSQRSLFAGLSEEQQHSVLDFIGGLAHGDLRKVADLRAEISSASSVLREGIDQISSKFPDPTPTATATATATATGSSSSSALPALPALALQFRNRVDSAIQHLLDQMEVAQAEASSILSSGLSQMATRATVVTPDQLPAPSAGLPSLANSVVDQFNQILDQILDRVQPGPGPGPGPRHQDDSSSASVSLKSVEEGLQASLDETEVALNNISVWMDRGKTMVTDLEDKVAILLGEKAHHVVEAGSLKTQITQLQGCLAHLFEEKELTEVTLRELQGSLAREKELTEVTLRDASVESAALRTQITELEGCLATEKEHSQVALREASVAHKSMVEDLKAEAHKWMVAYKAEVQAAKESKKEFHSQISLLHKEFEKTNDVAELVQQKEKRKKDAEAEAELA